MVEVMVREFVGLPSSSGWARVLQLRGETCSAHIVFSVQGRDAAAIGLELAAQIRAAVITDAQSLYFLLETIIARIEKTECVLSVAAGCLSGATGVWATHNAGIWVRRGSQPLKEVVSSPTLSMREGSVQPDDVYALSTASGAVLVKEMHILLERGYTFVGIETALGQNIATIPEVHAVALGLLMVGDIHADEMEESGEFGASVESKRVDADVEIAIEEREHEAWDVPPKTAYEDDVPSILKPSVTPVTNDVQIAKEPEDTQSSNTTPAKFDAERIKLNLARLAAVAARLGRGSVRLAKIAAKGAKKGAALSQGGAAKVQSLPWQRMMRNKRIVYTVIAVIVALVIAGIAFSVIRQGQTRAAEEAQAVLEPFYAQQRSMLSQAQVDPLAARKQAQDLVTSINQQLALADTQGLIRDNFTTLKNEVESFESQLVGEQAIVDVPVYFDLLTIAPDTVITHVTSLGGHAFLADETAGNAFSIDLASKQASVHTIDSLGDIRAITLRSPTEALVLADGLHSVSLDGAPTPPSQVKEGGDSNRDGTAIAAFETYVYVYNPVRRNIYRYLVRQNGYSDPIGWLLSPLGISAEDVQSMVIDGDVWISSKDGVIKKFTSGRATGFAVSELDEPFAGPLHLVTSSDASYLYALAPNQSRVVQLTKDGVFVKQVKSPIFAAATGIIVDEPTRSLYAVSGATIYRAQL